MGLGGRKGASLLGGPPLSPPPPSFLAWVLVGAGWALLQQGGSLPLAVARSGSTGLRHFSLHLKLGLGGGGERRRWRGKTLLLHRPSPVPTKTQSRKLGGPPGRGFLFDTPRPPPPSSWHSKKQRSPILPLFLAFCREMLVPSLPHQHYTTGLSHLDPGPWVSPAWHRGPYQPCCSITFHFLSWI